jgi:hypothetical protein
MVVSPDSNPPARPLRSMQTGQNSSVPENSLPQLGQVRWGCVLIFLTALQPSGRGLRPEPRRIHAIDALRAGRQSVRSKVIYAVSLDLAAGHQLGKCSLSPDAAGQVHQGRFADYSYKTAGNPNYRTIEQWNGRDLGHVFEPDLVGSRTAPERVSPAYRRVNKSAMSIAKSRPNTLRVNASF